MKYQTLLADALRVALLGLAMIGTAEAQQKIIISNGTQANKEIPLAAGSTVSFGADGNLTAECALTSGVCTPLASGGSAPTGAPTISSFARNDGDTDLRAGDVVRLTWASSGASACAATATGATTTWTGVRAVTNATGETVTVPSAGDYVFRLQCFNAAGGSVISSISATAAAATNPPPAENCTLPADPLIQPTGWTRVNTTWVTAFSSRDGDPTATYPSSVGFPVPVGAPKGGYTVIPFTPTAGLTVSLSWDVAQANGIQGYPNPRPADSMFVTISPCPGDVRAHVVNSADPWLRGGCREINSSGGIIYSTTEFETNESACKLTAGQTYYINVIAADPAGGLTAGEHTCAAVSNSSAGCDVNMVHRP